MVFSLLLVMLAIKPDRPHRGEEGGERLKLRIAAAVLVLALLPLVLQTPYWRGILILCAMNVLLALSLNLVLGYTGQLNLGQSAFFAIGAYVSTILIKTYGWNFWLASPVAVVAAGVLGLALAAFAVRLRGHYLAIASLGFAVITYQVLVNWERVTEGVRGIYGILPPPGFGNQVALFYLVGGIAARGLPPPRQPGALADRRDAARDPRGRGLRRLARHQRRTLEGVRFRSRRGDRGPRRLLLSRLRRHAGAGGLQHRRVVHHDGDGDRRRHGHHDRPGDRRRGAHVPPGTAARHRRAAAARLRPRAHAGGALHAGRHRPGLVGALGGSAR